MPNPPPPPLIYTVLRGGRYHPPPPPHAPFPPLSNTVGHAGINGDQPTYSRTKSMLSHALSTGKSVIEIEANQVVFLPWASLSADRLIGGSNLFGETLFIITGVEGAIVAILPSPVDHDLAFANPACSSARIREMTDQVIQLFYQHFDIGYENIEEDRKVTTVAVVVPKMYDSLWAPGQMYFLDRLISMIGLRPMIWGYDLENPNRGTSRRRNGHGDGDDEEYGYGNPGRFTFLIRGNAPENGVKSEIYVEDYLVEPIPGVTVGLYLELPLTG
ncbi:hypothetical protein L228DRAFT_270354 [Xylona heveae TC161]|uniref:Uncharacterized protein n=1 Tax=Xylona heveae (strain CBS 132557 / TC161) TaxID=1328760 RepID=A0A165ACW8_XYLHT|nr:hypothetical protein L228DRAFT_270354 [Xylona heveae TC161]KZF20268.1 hypothetical protein L228DRAFT_270354 [Xylona heveae TC161]